MQKSELIFNTNAEPDLKRYACAVFGIKELNYGSKYLGLLVVWGQTKKETFNFLIQRTSDKIQIWKAKFLNPAGR